jgi:hypothetical protein
MQNEGRIFTFRMWTTRSGERWSREFSSSVPVWLQVLPPIHRRQDGPRSRLAISLLRSLMSFFPRLRLGNLAAAPPNRLQRNDANARQLNRGVRRLHFLKPHYSDQRSTRVVGPALRMKLSKSRPALGLDRTRCPSMVSSTTFHEVDSGVA